MTRRLGVLALLIVALGLAFVPRPGPRHLVVAAVAGAAPSPRLDRLRSASVEVALSEAVSPADLVGEGASWPGVTAALEAATAGGLPPRRIAVGPGALDDAALGRLIDGLASPLPPSRTAWVILGPGRAWLLGPDCPEAPAAPLRAEELRALLGRWLGNAAR